MQQRTLTELRKHLNGKIHIYLKDRETAVQFLFDAENEGYRIGKKKPTECDTDNIFALGNKQISYLGTCGRICFQCNGGDLQAQGKYHRIDYDKYRNGASDFIF